MSHRQPYAADPAHSRGRRFAEQEHGYRNCWQRDRDRIVHSRAFRRLEYKTQVFPNHQGDHFRTRLTHTIEVAQLARTVANAIGLDSDLAEAIALAHDIGHPPFGHVGEEALDRLMHDQGGFEHNRHALRTVDELEDKYAGFRGLNLTYEVREGIAKHSSRYDRYQHGEISDFNPGERATLEAQLIDLVDHIAYNVHDIDDGVEAHILAVPVLAAEVPLFGRTYHRLRIDMPSASDRALFNETIRRLVDRLVTDLIDTTVGKIAEAGVGSLQQLREWPTNLAAHSDLIERELGALQGFLFESLYRSPRVEAEMQRASAVLQQLFEAYTGDPSQLPPRHQRRCAVVGTETAIADYVAGMTDRFVMREHERLFGGGEFAASPARYYD